MAAISFSKGTLFFLINLMGIGLWTSLGQIITSDTNPVATVLMGKERFSLGLYQTLSQTNSGNFAVSQIGVLMILGMLNNGMTGRVSKELHDSLNLPRNISVVNAAFQTLIDSLNRTTDDSSFQLSNYIFISSDIRGRDKFIVDNMEYFRTEAALVNFPDKNSVTKTINDWCEKKTNYTIRNLTNSDSLRYVDFMLADAVYFDGIWENKFHKRKTLMASYWVNGSVKYIPTMQKRARFDHGKIDKYKAKFIVLPYKSSSLDNDPEFKMYLITIPDAQRLKQLETDIADINFNALSTTSSLKDVMLPRLRFSTDLVLNDALRKMGIKEMFGYSVDLNGIIESQSAKVDKIIQKVTVEVDEEGTRIAAVTGGFAEPQTEPIHVYATLKPFIVAIVSDSYRTMLFSARIADPTVDFPLDTSAGRKNKHSSLAEFELFE